MTKENKNGNGWFSQLVNDEEIQVIQKMREKKRVKETQENNRKEFDRQSQLIKEKYNLMLEELKQMRMDELNELKDKLGVKGSARMSSGTRTSIANPNINAKNRIIELFCECTHTKNAIVDILLTDGTFINPGLDEKTFRGKVDHAVRSKQNYVKNATDKETGQKLFTYSDTDDERRTIHCATN